MIDEGYKYVVTAWGMIVNDYADNSQAMQEIVHSGKYIRQVIGQFQNGDYFVMSVDKTGYSGITAPTTNENGVTYSELAKFLIAKGVRIAYSLDGGGSCETVVGKRHVNPIYDGSVGRAVPSVIYFSTESIKPNEFEPITYAEIFLSNYALIGTESGRLTTNFYSGGIRKTLVSKDTAFVLYRGTSQLEYSLYALPKRATKIIVHCPNAISGIQLGTGTTDGQFVRKIDKGWNNNTIGEDYYMFNAGEYTWFSVNFKTPDGRAFPDDFDTSEWYVRIE